MPFLPAMLLQALAGEGAEVATQAVPQHMPAPDQPQAHLSTPSRQQTSDPNAPVREHGQSLDPNTASFSRSHETNAGPFTNVEDAPMGGTFHISPPRVYSLETELTDHKKLFKDVVGKLVKKVKALEVKLKTKKRKMVGSDSDQEEGGKQDVYLDALRALANAAMTIDSNISSGGTSQIPAASPSVPTAGPPDASTVLLGTSAVPIGALTVPAGSPSVPDNVPSSVAHAEQANFDRQRAELQRWRQEEVLDSAMYYTEADCLNIMAQVEANASLFKSLLGDDVSEDNFPARMSALIKRKRQALAAKLAQERQNRPMTQAQQRAYMRQYVKNQSSAIYTTGWTMAYVKSFADDQLKKEFKKIRKVPHSPAVSSPPSFRTRRKSLGQKRITKPKSTLLELDLDADAQTFIKVVVNEDSEDEASPVWSVLVGWEVIPTPLRGINALYRIGGSTKHFTTLRQILHMVG
nr:JmjC domain-containing protein [Tanacetum cinerariifolium]